MSTFVSEEFADGDAIEAALLKAVTALQPGEGASIVRSDTIGAVNYLGTAPVGTLESATGWTITRITLATDGTVATAVATDAVWTNRLTETYS